MKREIITGTTSNPGDLDQRHWWEIEWRDGSRLVATLTMPYYEQGYRNGTEAQLAAVRVLEAITREGDVALTTHA